MTFAEKIPEFLLAERLRRICARWGGGAKRNAIQLFVSRTPVHYHSLWLPALHFPCRLSAGRVLPMLPQRRCPAAASVLGWRRPCNPTIRHSVLSVYRSSLQIREKVYVGRHQNTLCLRTGVCVFDSEIMFDNIMFARNSTAFYGWIAVKSLFYLCEIRVIPRGNLLWFSLRRERNLKCPVKMKWHEYDP